MSGYSTDPGDDESGDIGTHRDRSGLAVGSLGRAAGRLVREPILFLPFAAFALVLTGVDVLRRRDPIPAITWESVTPGTINVDYALYPTPQSQTVRPLQALIDLDVPYLLWAAGLEFLVIGSIVLAGVIVINQGLADARIDTPPVRDRFASYLGFVVAVDLLGRFVGGLGVFQEMPLLIGVPVLIVAAVVGVRLFLTPVLLVAGRSLPVAIRESNQRSFGHGWSFFGLILLFGLGTWVLASVPIVGTLLTGLFIAPLQAVTLVVVFEWVSAAEDGDTGVGA
ncbi:hypothetical protein Halru_2448 [Halovivax ruber XH-70]|uniref:Integral membrane protein n=1 Tax=Halovivax ruber (strain DSM 18193 / JCM 13892 / XH-70) TaxID=797302 RepID=L0IBT5_HALRX|nr:hypothetical protein [Halovivax ruber]AGB17030.1 hypothetical protein Halru_2448 [Halovivax ruber XH-70]